LETVLNTLFYYVIISNFGLQDQLRDPKTVFVPSVETIHGPQSFLVETPEQILKKGNFSKIPWLTGVNSEEGLIISSQIMRNESLIEVGESHWGLLAPNFLYYENDEPTSQKIRDFYFGKNFEKTNNGIDKLDSYTALIGDRHFFVGVAEAIEFHAKEAPTYIYFYTYAGEFSLANILLAIRGRFPIIVELVSHFLSTWVKKTLFGINPPRYGKF
jgi:carboxylesterase type B